MRDLCARQTAVFWVTAPTCCISLSDRHISKHTKAFNIIWRCLLAPSRGKPCLALFAIFSLSAVLLALSSLASAFAQLSRSALPLERMSHAVSTYCSLPHTAAMLSSLLALRSLGFYVANGNTKPQEGVLRSCIV